MFKNVQDGSRRSRKSQEVPGRFKNIKECSRKLKKVQESFAKN